MNATHFKNKSGYVVKANDMMRRYWKELELEPVYESAVKDTTAEDIKRAELKAKTVTELKALCKDASVTGYSKMTEDELIDALIAAE